MQGTVWYRGWCLEQYQTVILLGFRVIPVSMDWLLGNDSIDLATSLVTGSHTHHLGCGFPL